MDNENNAPIEEVSTQNARPKRIVPRRVVAKGADSTSLDLKVVQKKTLILTFNQEKKNADCVNGFSVDRYRAF